MKQKLAIITIAAFLLTNIPTSYNTAQQSTENVQSIPLFQKVESKTPQLKTTEELKIIQKQRLEKIKNKIQNPNFATNLTDKISKKLQLDQDQQKQFASINQKLALHLNHLIEENKLNKKNAKYVLQKVGKKYTNALTFLNPEQQQKFQALKQKITFRARWCDAKWISKKINKELHLNPDQAQQFVQQNKTVSQALAQFVVNEKPAKKQIKAELLELLNKNTNQYQQILTAAEIQKISEYGKNVLRGRKR